MDVPSLIQVTVELTDFVFFFVIPSVFYLIQSRRKIGILLDVCLFFHQNFYVKWKSFTWVKNINKLDANSSITQ